MNLDPRSPEFSRLATRWLDGVATREEAERLWACIVANKGCAAEFAMHARFESLLEQTSWERAREATVAGVVQKEGKRHQRKSWMKLAALILLIGMAVRLLWPDAATPVVVHQPEVPVSPVNPPPREPKKHLAVQPMQMLVSPRASDSSSEPVVKTFAQRLDEFFLTSVSLDRVPLREAMQRLEAQLRALNYTKMADLARLRATIPAEAAGREVSFQSGAISYLKAVRAVAALANCEVSVFDTSLALTTLMDPQKQSIQSRSVESLLANDGAGLHSQLSELLEDARALGLVNEGGPSQPVSLRGTRAQFIALAELADSRRQIRNLPDIGLLPFLYPAKVDAKGKALTESEAREQLRIATQGGTVKPKTLKVKPSVYPSQDAEMESAEVPMLVISAIPAGPYYIVSVNGDDSQPASQTPVIAAEGVDVVLPPDGGVIVPVDVPPSGRISVASGNPPLLVAAMPGFRNDVSVSSSSATPPAGSVVPTGNVNLSMVDTTSPGTLSATSGITLQLDSALVLGAGAITKAAALNFSSATNNYSGGTITSNGGSLGVGVIVINHPP